MKKKNRVVQKNSDQEKISPRLKKLIGAVKLPTDFDEKRVGGLLQEETQLRTGTSWPAP